MRQHALLSASGAYRWLNCTPSAVLEDKVEESTSIYASEGTLAHDLAELEIKWGLNMIDKKEYSIKYGEIQANDLYNADMDNEVEKYKNLILEEFAASKAKTKDALILIEQKVDLSFIIEEGFGKCDTIIIADRTMKVIDLKYGQGVKVSAVKNPQLMLYSLGALEEFGFLYDIDNVVLTIAQPRLDNWSSFEISAKDLKSWGENFVKPKAAEAFEGKGVQVAGEWCKFCRVKARCATLASYSMKVAQHEFKDPHLLTDDQLIEVYKKQPIITDWIGAVAEFMLKEALNGKEWSGYKLVEGRSNRRITDENEAIRVLRENNYKDEQILNTKIKGLTDLTKILGKDKFSLLLDPLITKPPGKPILVELSDKREALRDLDSAKEVFNI